MWAYASKILVFLSNHLPIVVGSHGDVFFFQCFICLHLLPFFMFYLLNMIYVVLPFFDVLLRWSMIYTTLPLFNVSLVHYQRCSWCLWCKIVEKLLHCILVIILGIEREGKPITHFSVVDQHKGRERERDLKGRRNCYMERQ